MNHTARLEQAHDQLLAARNEEERQEAQHTFTGIFFEPFAQEQDTMNTNQTELPNPREVEAAKKLWAMPANAKVIVEVIRPGHETRTITGSALGVADYLATHTIEHDRFRLLVNA